MMGIDVTGIGAVADLATTVINKFFPDKSEQEKQQLAMAMTVIQGQLTANAKEAESASVFVSGWRPFVGWVCGTGCAWNWVGLPIAKALLGLAGVTVAVSPADISELMPLLFALLGLGGLRTVEKIQGVAAK